VCAAAQRDLIRAMPACVREGQQVVELERVV
jgi:hypothetical protein